MKFNSRPVILFSVFGILAAVICVFLMGGGHGYYEPAMILFPWGMLGLLMPENIAPLFIIIGLMQYPVYGFIIGNRKQIRNSDVIMVLLGLLHAGLVALVMIKTDF